MQHEILAGRVERLPELTPMLAGLALVLLGGRPGGDEASQHADAPPASGVTAATE